MPTNMAELGSDNFDQELTLSLLGSEKDALDQIEAALERIEDGSYGLCESAAGRSPSPALRPSPMRPCASGVRRKRKTARGRKPNDKALALAAMMVIRIGAAETPISLRQPLRQRRSPPPT